MRTRLPVGILGHGAYDPRRHLDPARGDEPRGQVGASPSPAPPVAAWDEDAITMALEAAQSALLRAEVPATKLRAVWVASRSSPSAGKPRAAILAELLGTGPRLWAADVGASGRSGVEALQLALALVGSGMAGHALGVAVDPPAAGAGEDGEPAAGPGGAAFVAGPGDEAIAVLEGSLSHLPDAFDGLHRRPARPPRRGGRNGRHLEQCGEAARGLLEESGLGTADVDHVVFEPQLARSLSDAAAVLGFAPEQLATGLAGGRAGSSGAGSALRGLCAVLDVARPDRRVLCLGYGAGAGCDAFLLRTTARLSTVQARPVPGRREYLEAGPPSAGQPPHRRVKPSISSCDSLTRRDP